MGTEVSKPVVTTKEDTQNSEAGTEVDKTNSSFAVQTVLGPKTEGSGAYNKKIRFGVLEQR